MMSLIIAFLTSGGAVGFGSILKMIAGIFDSKAKREEIYAQREIIRELESRDLDLAWQQAIFGGEDGKSARYTRRIVAIIGMLTFAVGTLWCTVFPDIPLITMESAITTTTGEYSFIFGLITIPAENELLQITLGHIALVNYNILGMIVGFYFTPGGRK